jgi:hypothetical protein
VRICKKKQFEKIQQIVVQLIQKGYIKEVAKVGVILQGMMDMFCHLAKEIGESKPA